MYTYFIMSPGADIKSYVQYNDGAKGNYIKFGDAGSNAGGVGIRQAYLTHNPDIGIAAVMDSSAFSNPNLGTRLKNYITSTCNIEPVNSAPEWFSIQSGAAQALFNAMIKWDGKTLAANDLTVLQNIISKCLV